jgi:hypothetical protein
MAAIGQESQNHPDDAVTLRLDTGADAKVVVSLRYGESVCLPAEIVKSSEPECSNVWGETDNNTAKNALCGVAVGRKKLAIGRSRQRR